MKEYLYPQNLKSEAGLFLWTMRDFSVVAVAALISALVFAATKSPMPMAVTGAYAFLTIRFEEVCIRVATRWSHINLPRAPA